MCKNEVWKSVPLKSYNKYYEISNMGRVKSNTHFIYQRDCKNNWRKHIIKGQILHPVNNFIYFTSSNPVNLYRLVARAFVFNPYNFNHVKHINGDVNDNRASNLKWYSLNGKYKNEVWKPVPIKPYNINYRVSNYGRVKSIDHYTSNGSHRMGRILSLQNRTGNYLYAVCCYNKHVKAFRVNRLVAKAFIPNPHSYPVVNHIDENRHNNKVSNLEWCSIEYNDNYNHRNKRVANSTKGKSKPVQYKPIILQGKTAHLFESHKEATLWLSEHYGYKSGPKSCRRHIGSFNIINL